MYESKKNFSRKEFWFQNNFQVQIILVQKKMWWVQLGSKKIVDQKIYVQKKLGSKIILVGKKILGPKKIFG